MENTAILPVIKAKELTLPIVASAQLSQVALYINDCINAVRQEALSTGSLAPPPVLISWIKLYLDTLKTIHSMSGSATDKALEEGNVQKVVINTYNLFRTQLPEEARIAMAKVVKKVVDADVVDE